VLKDGLSRFEPWFLGEMADGDVVGRKGFAVEVRVEAAMTRRSVLLPAPLAPRTPIFAPA